MAFPYSVKITVVYGVAGQEHFLLRQTECPQDLDLLKNLIYTRCPRLSQYAAIKMFWIDADGDEVNIGNDDEYVSYMINENNSDPTRIYVKATAQGEEEFGSHLTIHDDVVCDICDASIVGHRYKCLECEDLDLCGQCEGKYLHKEHFVLRIPRPITCTPANLEAMVDKMRSTFIEE